MVYKQSNNRHNLTLVGKVGCDKRGEKKFADVANNKKI